MMNDEDRASKTPREAGRTGKPAGLHAALLAESDPKHTDIAIVDEACINGKEIVRMLRDQGCNVIFVGEE